jgi:hypothetical protein
LIGLMTATADLAAAEPDPRAKDLPPVTWKAAPRHAPIPLVEAGTARATICVMGPRSATLHQAVANLQAFIKQATGAELKIIQNKIVAPAIAIGDCDAAKALGLQGKSLPVEGFAIKTAPEGVFIVGHDADVGEGVRSEGTAWGVTDFLERFVGVRWYFPGELGQSVPKHMTLTVAPAWLEDAPVFRKREIWPPMSNPWNGTGTQLGPLHTFLRSANSHPRVLAVHAPDWSKVKEYREGRPEVFQQRSDGTRDHFMLCYGHPRTLETYLENIERHAKKAEPVHVSIRNKAVTVSPNDAEIACYCPHCRKLWDAKLGQYGSASRIVADFVARLGREMKARWPDMTIVYLPYLNYTLAPDGVTLPDNVEVQLCGMPGLAQYKEPAIAKSEQANIDAWGRLTGRKIQNWHYSCWPEDRTPAVYLFPHTIQEFYRANRDKTVGTFINGTTDHWPRQHLSLYCWLKVLWNPEFDVDAAIDEYCQRMYGAAAGSMRELVKLQSEGWERSRWPGERLSPKGIHEASYPHATVQRMEALLQQARKQAAGDEPALKRIDYYAGPFAAFFERDKAYASGGGLRPLLAQKVGENPKLDGQLDDAVWQRAEPIAFVRGWDKKETKPTYATTVRAVWTTEGVTFGFRMEEPTPDRLERNIKGRDDSMAWWDDNVELLFDVTGRNEGEFYHFIINVNGAVADAKGKDFSQNYSEVKLAAAVGKDFWGLEVFVPFAAFKEAAKPGSGTNTAWYGNFTRHRVADLGLKPKFKSHPGSVREYSRMNTTYAVPSNNLGDFAPIRFVE